MNAFLGADPKAGFQPKRDPILRALDERVEAVELRLREVVAETLGDDASRLPTHVTQKINERSSAATRKNPRLAGSTPRLVDKLAFCDLKELEDTIGARSLWPLFESRFQSKGVLATRWAQLTELRNAIRHSRPMNQVTRKDGEAALLWFSEVLRDPVDGEMAADEPSNDGDEMSTPTLHYPINSSELCRRLLGRELHKAGSGQTDRPLVNEVRRLLGEFNCPRAISNGRPNYVVDHEMAERVAQELGLSLG